MPQLLLPGMPDGAIRINPVVSLLSKGGHATWFVGPDNYFSHPAGDLAGHRLALATLMANGHARPCEIRKALGTAQRSLMRWRGQLEERGAGSFYQPQAVRGAAVLAAGKSAECQRLLDEGHTIAAAFGLAGSAATRFEPATDLILGGDGSDANLPRRYVSRQKLCLRGTTDYWINDALGRPFFVISKAVTEGLAKTLTDTVKMIAYRAETALVGLLRKHLATEAEARALIRELFVSSADLAPDDNAGTLTIRIHRMACPAHDRAIALLLADLTATGFIHPETGHRFIYQLV